MCNALENMEIATVTVVTMAANVKCKVFTFYWMLAMKIVGTFSPSLPMFIAVLSHLFSELKKKIKVSTAPFTHTCIRWLQYSEKWRTNASTFMNFGDKYRRCNILIDQNNSNFNNLCHNMPSYDLRIIHYSKERFQTTMAQSWDKLMRLTWIIRSNW